MNDISVKIDNLSLKELEELLKELKLYNNLKKQLGKRWEKLYKEQKTWKKSFEVEYFPAAGEDLAWEKSKEVFEKVFWYKVERKDITFIPKEKIAWWIRIYTDDKILDLSYENIEKKLRG